MTQMTNLPRKEVDVEDMQWWCDSTRARKIKDDLSRDQCYEHGVCRAGVEIDAVQSIASQCYSAIPTVVANKRLDCIVLAQWVGV
jgi:hypothetical protein